MEITQNLGDDWLELRLVGRLDTTWAEHVSQTIETAVQSGSHRILLNFSQVEYISSLGIRVLLTHFKRLSSVNGRLSVTEPSEPTLRILKATGLAEILIGDALSTPLTGAASAKTVVRGNARYEMYTVDAPVPLRCAAIGRPEGIVGSGYGSEDCRALTFDNGTFGLGLGAFGEGFEDCRNRFGEYLALGGCAVSLPTDHAHGRPDFVVEQGAFVPRVQTLYGLIGSGDFPTMVRFDTLAEGAGAVVLSELVDSLLALSGGDALVFAALVESAGLVGASLLRSPGAGPLSLELPHVRDTLSFTTERIGDGALALLLGFVVKSPTDPVSRFLRPLAAESDVAAHVHAAVFPYRPVQRGELAFASTFAELFASTTPEPVVHLLSDARPFEGVGESELVRGACWMGTLDSIAAESVG
ncbi:MAG TPA: STAS domain-containing protein [Gammaproteobacteria bacterium]|nr:STAS domain-containing protein [Gammaproteobacteria bacterium]